MGLQNYMIKWKCCPEIAITTYLTLSMLSGISTAWKWGSVWESVSNNIFTYSHVFIFKCSHIFQKMYFSSDHICLLWFSNLINLLIIMKNRRFSNYWRLFVSLLSAYLESLISEMNDLLKLVYFRQFRSLAGSIIMTNCMFLRTLWVW